MRAIVALLTTVLGAGTAMSAQTSQDSPHLTPRNGVTTTATKDPAPVQFVTVSSGTKIPLTLKQGDHDQKRASRRSRLRANGISHHDGRPDRHSRRNFRTG